MTPMTGAPRSDAQGVPEGRQVRRRAGQYRDAVPDDDDAVGPRKSMGRRSELATMRSESPSIRRMRAFRPQMDLRSGFSRQGSHGQSRHGKRSLPRRRAPVQTAAEFVTTRPIPRLRMSRAAARVAPMFQTRENGCSKPWTLRSASTSSGPPSIRCRPRPRLRSKDRDAARRGAAKVPAVEPFERIEGASSLPLR